jgi:hypothetical protein
MTAPDESQQLDIAEVAAVMESDPLSKALFENAQLKVMLRKQTASNQLLLDRVRELETQRDPEQP